MDETINNISLKHFESLPESLEQIVDKGKVNQVFKVLINGQHYIFRLNKKEYLPTYQKEFFCIKKAREAAIKTSDVHYVGAEGAYSYMILNYITGINGVDLPEEKHGEVYKTLGSYAKAFNQMEVGGFGRDVKDEQIGFFKDWDSFYQETMDGLFGTTILIDKGVVTVEQSEKITKRLSEMKQWKVTPMLCHGNLHITNTIITDDGDVYVIDWGNGAGHMAPHVDLADVIAWKDRRHLNNFLEGYGMSMEEFNKIEHDVNNLLIIQLLNVITYAFEIDKTFLNQDFITNSIERIMQLA